MKRDEPSTTPDLVTGMLAIRQLLEALSRSHEPLAIACPDVPEAPLTGWIEAVEESAGHLRLGTEPACELPRAGSRLNIRGRADGVEVAFEIDVIDRQPGTRDGEPMYRFKLPARAERLQRRDAYRIRAMRGHSLGDLVRRLGGSERQYPIVDLSGDGVGLLVDDGSPPATGDVWRNCRLEFGDEAPIPCDLAVRTLTRSPEGSTLRVGCAFEHPPAETRRSIEKYVLDFQRATRGNPGT